MINNKIMFMKNMKYQPNEDNIYVLDPDQITHIHNV